MKYKVTTDKDGFVESVISSDNGIELDLQAIILDRLNCYVLTGNKLVLDTEKYNSQIAQEEKETRINQIILELTRSNYIQDEFINSLLSLTNPVTFITDLIALIISTMKDYPSLIAERKALITELKSLIK